VLLLWLEDLCLVGFEAEIVRVEGDWSIFASRVKVAFGLSRRDVVLRGDPEELASEGRIFGVAGEESSTQSITRAVNTSILEGDCGGRFRKSSSRQLQCQFTVSISSSNNDGDGGGDDS